MKLTVRSEAGELPDDVTFEDKTRYKEIRERGNELKRQMLDALFDTLSNLPPALWVSTADN